MKLVTMLVTAVALGVSFAETSTVRGTRLDKPRGRVMFWYDTEDYVCDAADEGTLFHANMLSELGVRGNFNLVGFYAQRLVERGHWAGRE